jgi:hypothetical protein
MLKPVYNTQTDKISFLGFRQVSWDRKVTFLIRAFGGEPLLRDPVNLDHKGPPLKRDASKGLLPNNK